MRARTVYHKTLAVKADCVLGGRPPVHNPLFYLKIHNRRGRCSLIIMFTRRARTKTQGKAQAEPFTRKRASAFKAHSGNRPPRAVDASH